MEVAPDQDRGTFTYLNRRRTPFLTFEFRYRVDVSRLARQKKLPPLYTAPALVKPAKVFGPIETITLSDDEDEVELPAVAPRPGLPSSEQRTRKTQSNRLAEECLVLSDSDDEMEAGSEAGEVRAPEAKRRKVTDSAAAVGVAV